MTRTEILELARSYNKLSAKVRRNAHKLAWMDATRRMGAEAVSFGADLERYESEARAAAKRLSAAWVGLPTEEIVSIIEEAGA